MVTKRRIVIIEDDIAISEMYRLKLQSEGYEVQVAKNGRDGLELIQKLKPDMILLDLMMPEMTGEELLQELRKTEEGKKVKVVVLTNIGENELPESLRAMVDRYIVKAYYTPQQVVDLVKDSLKKV